jgi:CheY-like chemotaxis protein
MTTAPAVLYVEDDPQSRRVMLMLLQGRLKLPHVTVFEDSQNFLRQLEQLDPKPDVIFLDIHMQPHDGFEMLGMLRQLAWAREKPIIALTASVMNEEVRKLKAAGFNGCLAKPINLAVFPELFNRILNGDAIWRITD